jgi:hypothetical protein
MLLGALCPFQLGYGMADHANYFQGTLCRRFPEPHGAALRFGRNRKKGVFSNILVLAEHRPLSGHKSRSLDWSYIFGSATNGWTGRSFLPSDDRPNDRP